MQYPVLLQPWPPESAEPRRIDWSEYLEDPTVGLILDPKDLRPLPDLISVRLRVLDRPPDDALPAVQIGEVVEVPLADFLSIESRRLELGRIPWAQRLGFEAHYEPAAVRDEEGSGSPAATDFEAIRSFLFETLAAGPVSELEVIGMAADAGIAPASLREAKERLRIASVRDEDAPYPRTLWRLRMSQAYKLKKRDRPDRRR